jgi:hypothetical protein
MWSSTLRHCGKILAQFRAWETARGSLSACRGLPVTHPQGN